MRTTCLRVLSIVGTVACVSTVKVRVDDLYRKSGLSRASFELHCPESDLAVTTLSVDKERDYRLLGDQQAFPVKGDTVGVRGCGREAIYVYAGPAGWVNNTGSEAPAK